MRGRPGLAGGVEQRRARRAARAAQARQTPRDGARDIKKSGGLLREGERVMFQLVDAEKAHYPVTMLCEVLEVSRSGYYDWKKRPCCDRSRRMRSSPSRSRWRTRRAANDTAAHAFTEPFAERASESARKGSSG